jgi:hypothetical protein
VNGPEAAVGQYGTLLNAGALVVRIGGAPFEALSRSTRKILVRAIFEGFASVTWRRRDRGRDAIVVAGEPSLPDDHQRR